MKGICPAGGLECGRHAQRLVHRNEAILPTVKNENGHGDPVGSLHGQSRAIVLRRPVGVVGPDVGPSGVSLVAIDELRSTAAASRSVGPAMTATARTGAPCFNARLVIVPPRETPSMNRRAGSTTSSDCASRTTASTVFHVAAAPLVPSRRLAVKSIVGRDDHEPGFREEVAVDDRQVIDAAEIARTAAVVDDRRPSPTVCVFSGAPAPLGTRMAPLSYWTSKIVDSLLL
jgi:hypothetical protein